MSEIPVFLIIDMVKDNLDPDKKYKVAGWASVAEPREGIPIWEVVEQYLLKKETVTIKELNLPKIKGVSSDPGFVV